MRISHYSNPNPSRYSKARITRCHVTGDLTSRDIDLDDPVAWDRVCRSARDTLLSGGSHVMAALHGSEGPPVVESSRLRQRVEALESWVARANTENIPVSLWSEGVDLLSSIPKKTPDVKPRLLTTAAESREKWRISESIHE